MAAKDSKVMVPEPPVPDADLEELIEILEIEDDLDTGMHRVNCC